HDYSLFTTGMSVKKLRAKFMAKDDEFVISFSIRRPYRARYLANSQSIAGEQTLCGQPQFSFDERQGRGNRRSHDCNSSASHRRMGTCPAALRKTEPVQVL